MKRFLVCVLTLCMIASVPILSVGAETETDGVFTLLSELEIMTGDPDGNLRLDDTVTRAEFTKMAVAASSYKNSVAVHLAVSPFPDVTWQHWAAPYVRVGVSNNLVSGYPDATFRPDDTVLFEEGVTILLRVLGYTETDFGASWPYGQIGLANNLELTDSVNAEAGQTLNRRQVAQLIYNALGCKFKGQNSQLASVFDVTITENVTLISDGNDDSSIASNEVYTSAGTYQITSGYDRTQLGLEGSVAVKDGKKLLSFVPNAESTNSSERYVLYSVLPGGVMVYKNGTLSQLTVKDNTPVYKGKSQSTFGNLKSSLELGDILRVKTSGTGIDSITCQSGDILGPTVVSSTGLQSTGWDVTSSTRVMRNGQIASTDGLEAYDIAYFMPEMDLVLAYSDKVTGVYESASPNIDTPQSVTVSGKTYQIESGSAFTALASGGSFSYGDTVTLLLGKDGQVAAAISPNATSNKSMVGYLLETGRKDYETGVSNSYSGYYVKLAFPNGTTGEYSTDRSYSSYQNKVVRLSFQNGYARVLTLSDNTSTISGTYDRETGKLGKYTLAADAEILDIGTTDSNSSSVYCRVYPQRLDGVSISASQVLYYTKNSAGKIDSMILKDVTGDGFSYGLMMTATQDKQKFSGSYSYMVDGQLYQLNTSNRLLNVSSGSGIKIAGNPSNPDSVSRLTELNGGIKLTNSGELTYNNTTYPISGNVAVYQRSSSYSTAYVKIPLTDILNKDDITISAYCDNAPSAGGRVRVIVVY